MNPRDEIIALQEIGDEIIAALEEMVASGQNISDAQEEELTNILEDIIARITELYQELENNPTEGMQPITALQENLTQAMPSSNVEGFGYDEDSGRLLVRFLGKYPNKNGPIYAYDKVPKVIFELFRRGAVPARTDGKNRWGKWWKGKNPSIGASLFTLIKNEGYNYTRLT